MLFVAIFVIIDPFYFQTNFGRGHVASNFFFDRQLETSFFLGVTISRCDYELVFSLKCQWFLGSLLLKASGKDLSNSTKSLVRQNLTRNNVIIPRMEFCMNAQSACKWDKLHQMSSGRRTICLTSSPCSPDMPPLFLVSSHYI